MKKFAKLSLVASMAVASFSVANAQDLAQAIQNVDVSGTIAYRYNDYETTENRNTNAKSQNGTNNYKIAMNLSTKVNEDVKVNTRFLAQSFDMDTGSSPDGNVDVELSEVNFTYTGLNNATFTLGKQAINTAFTVARDSIGTEQVGTGLVGTYNIGPVNLFAAYFNQNNFDSTNEHSLTFNGGEDVIAAGISASFGGINMDASYVDVESDVSTSDSFDAYTIGLDAAYDIGEVKLSSYARYSALDLDNTDVDNSLWKVGVKANMGIFGAYLAYGATDDEGGVVGIDASSTTGFDEHWRVTLSGVSDADVVYAAIDAQVTDKINLALKYSDLDADSDSNWQDEDEIYGQVVYQMSKNFFTYARFGVLDRENLKDDVTIGRLHVQYSF